MASQAEATAPSSWRLVHHDRPMPENRHRRLHPYERARHDRQWRTVFCFLARQAHVPRLTAATLTVVQHVQGRAGIPDVGACYPTAKAAIDGLVDADVIPDDDPTHLGPVTYDVRIASELGHALELVITARPVELDQ